MPSDTESERETEQRDSMAKRRRISAKIDDYSRRRDEHLSEELREAILEDAPTGVKRVAVSLRGLDLEDGEGFRPIVRITDESGVIISFAWDDDESRHLEIIVECGYAHFRFTPALKTFTSHRLADFCKMKVLLRPKVLDELIGIVKDQASELHANTALSAKFQAAAVGLDDSPFLTVTTTCTDQDYHTSSNAQTFKI